MKLLRILSNAGVGFAVVLLSAGWMSANATEPCGDFGECKVLVEINSSDGDIGFHFLGDGDDLISMALFDPRYRKIYFDRVKGPFFRQTKTETFVESAEPLCFEPDPEDLDEGETLEDIEVVTLEDFVRRWRAGTYYFFGIGKGFEFSFGQTDLSFNLPPAPIDIEFELEEDEPGEFEGEISWAAGSDLGECWEEGDELPRGVTIAGMADIASWEIVLEPEFEEGSDNAQKGLVFVNRIGADTLVGEYDDEGQLRYEVEVPDDYLEALPINTAVKVEIGAITSDDNATFTEEGEWCVNEVDADPDDDVDGCGLEIELEDD